MIRALRRRHPWLVGLVALVVGALLATALWMRPDPPYQDRLGDAIEASIE